MLFVRGKKEKVWPSRGEEKSYLRDGRGECVHRWVAAMAAVDPLKVRPVYKLRPMARDQSNGDLKLFVGTICGITFPCVPYHHIHTSPSTDILTFLQTNRPRLCVYIGVLVSLSSLI